MPSYLDKLPESARRVGRAENEITLLTDPAEIETIRRQRAEDVRRGALPPGSDNIGIAFEDEYFLVVRDAVRFPSGERGTYVRVFERSALDGPSGVVMVAARNGRVLLRRMFRHATRSWELECPRGFREAGRTVAETLEDEARQELGLPIIRTEHLGHVAPNTGLFAGVAEAFYIEVGDGRPQPRPDPQEALGGIEECPADELLRRVASGDIRDGFSLSALFLAHSRGLLASSS